MEFQWSELIWPSECKPFQKLYINNSKIEFLLPKYNKEGIQFVVNFSMQMIFLNFKCSWLLNYLMFENVKNRLVIIF